MGETIVEVVKVIAPIALDALAQAAISLIAADPKMSKKVAIQKITGDPETDGQIIDTDTTSYITTQFGNTFGYFYEGLRSQPTSGALPIAADQDIIVWNPAKNEVTDINAYLTAVFKDSLSPSDAIEASQNLSSIFQAKFTEVDLSWNPFDKRYNFPDGTIVDMFMVTAAGYDANNNTMGIVNYCFVAYTKG